MWTLLVLCDHWQGEFCVALFGALGWASLCIILPGAMERTNYEVMQKIMSIHYWQVYFTIFGTMQLIGLSRPKLHPARLAGAFANFLGFLIMVYAILTTKPIPLGLSMYVACAAIEGFAVVFHTGQAVRSYKGLPRWIIKH